MHFNLHLPKASAFCLHISMETKCNTEVADEWSDWHITLVHGTWGRGFFPHEMRLGKPRWFDEGSRFRNSLDVIFQHRPPTVDVFKWSGSNSIVARDEAGRRLAASLRRQKTASPATKQLVIAHSHGGNVALRAVHHMGGQIEDLRIATLACPFVEVFAPASDHVPWQKYFFLGLPLFLIAGGLLQLLSSFFPLGGKLQLLMAFYLLIALIVARLFEIWRIRRDAHSKESFDDRIAQITSHGDFARSDVGLLVMRGVDDEASLALAAGAISSWISRVLGVRASFGILSVAYRLWPLLVIFIIVSLIWPDSRWMPLSSSIFAWIIGLFLAPIAMIWVTLGIASICDAVYGKELLFRLLSSEISSNSVPDCDHGLTVHTLGEGARSSRFGRHSLYDHEDCVSQIVTWAMNGFAGKRNRFERDEKRTTWFLSTLGRTGDPRG